MTIWVQFDYRQRSWLFSRRLCLITQLIIWFKGIGFAKFLQLVSSHNFGSELQLALNPRHSQGYWLLDFFFSPFLETRGRSFIKYILFFFFCVFCVLLLILLSFKFGILLLLFLHRKYMGLVFIMFPFFPMVFSVSYYYYYTTTTLFDNSISVSASKRMPIFASLLSLDFRARQTWSLKLRSIIWLFIHSAQRPQINRPYHCATEVTKGQHCNGQTYRAPLGRCMRRMGDLGFQTHGPNIRPPRKNSMERITRFFESHAEHIYQHHTHTKHHHTTPPTKSAAHLYHSILPYTWTTTFSSYPPVSVVPGPRYPRYTQKKISSRIHILPYLSSLFSRISDDLTKNEESTHTIIITIPDNGLLEEIQSPDKPAGRRGKIYLS